MYQEISRLIMYGNLPPDSILVKLGDIFAEIDRDKEYHTDEMVRAVYEQIYRLLELATKYGFDDNLWHCYIAFLLAMQENPFSILCETVGASREASANQIVREDMKSFYRLFHYDFSQKESELGIDCFRIVTHYHSMAKAENTYNKSVSEKVRELAKNLLSAKDSDEMFDILTSFYQRYGVGKFGLNQAFRVIHREDEVLLSPITHTSDVSLEDLIGYEEQKRQFLENTEAFVEGRKANNCLLWNRKIHLYQSNPQPVLRSGTSAD